MLRPENTAANVERFPIQLLRFDVVAFVIQNVGQVVHRRECIRMLRPENTLPNPIACCRSNCARG